MAENLPGRTLERPSFENAFAAPAFVRAMLDFEVALAEGEAAEGVIEPAAAKAIVAACGTIRFDIDALVAEGKQSVSLAVPMARILRETVARNSPAFGKQVHFGATSQDVLDTAMVLCLKPCLEEADRALEAAIRSLARRAREHRATPMLGRTLMQPALMVTAGLKIGRWALALAQDRERLGESQAAALAIQFGGAVGALEALGTKGPAVRHRMALKLGLADSPTWHVHRSAWLDLMGRIAQVVATTGKIARDVALLAQPEVGEMLEGAPREGVGASSAMPFKRNPAMCAHALAAATRMPGLLATMHSAAIMENERALGGWQAEFATVPGIASVLGTSLDFLDTVSSSLVVNAERMRANATAYGAEPPAASLEAAADELIAELASYLT
jgi:3-carboxy-cis,cis-muconate cycloisomerase